MQLFTQAKNTLSTLKEKPFKLKKDMQLLFESSLKTITGLQLIKSEFIIKGQRFDTVAYDPDSKAFISLIAFINN
ncbi:hypothetical protein [Sphingobacterium haloxyli]|uniref:Uncharacterized protein n=1 Tax=Sphingobacterium haloxyli TaxID=2100533 RepID=A0A2S9J025_9SPHI|nr:hypothetical protein [Sphingobacterium haloxyli]PRD46098.1 hypothetical protein C5745_16880 [Sphingobacterium haloxyli]